VTVPFQIPTKRSRLDVVSDSTNGDIFAVLAVWILNYLAVIWVTVSCTIRIPLIEYIAEQNELVRIDLHYPTLHQLQLDHDCNLHRCRQHSNIQWWTSCHRDKKCLWGRKFDVQPDHDNTTSSSSITGLINLSLFLRYSCSFNITYADIVFRRP